MLSLPPEAPARFLTSPLMREAGRGIGGTEIPDPSRPAAGAGGDTSRSAKSSSGSTRPGGRRASPRWNDGVITDPSARTAARNMLFGIGVGVRGVEPAREERPGLARIRTDSVALRVAEGLAVERLIVDKAISSAPEIATGAGPVDEVQSAGAVERLAC